MAYDRAKNMEKARLISKIREIFGRKTNKERKNGLIPAVIYGKGMKSVSLWVKALDLKKVIGKFGENPIVELEMEKGEKNNAIIHEIQRDPVSGSFLHVDFYKVRMDEKLETEVELNFIGEAPAIKELGGILVKNLTAVEVSCLPADLPTNINVDLSILKTFEDSIRVKDLKIPEKVEVKNDPETTIALIEEPRSEEELKALEEEVEEDVTKVEGVVKEEPVAEGEKVEGAEEKPAPAKATEGEAKTEK